MDTSKLGKIIVLLIVLSLPYNLVSNNRLTIKSDTLKPEISGWKRNAHVIALGFGVPSYANDWFNSMLKPTNSYTISSLTKSLNLHLKFEFFVSKHFGLGATVNYGKTDYIYLREVKSYYKYEIEKTPIATEVVSLNLRLNYHILYNRVVDIYLGGGTGIRLVKTNSKSNSIPDLYKSGAFREHELSIGVRYFVKGIVGMFAEVGLGRTLVQVGINFNIKK